MRSIWQSQHILASGLVAAVGVGVAYISYTAQPSQAFLFPRIISTCFAVLAIWTFGKALMGKTKVGNGLTRTTMIHLTPGVVVALVYIFWAAKALGFYTASALTFFVLLTLYDPAPHTEVRSWFKRSVITAVFIAVMYGLFAMLLNVYTPREIFF